MFQGFRRLGSAAGPQPVRRTPVNGRREPTHANEEFPGQGAVRGSTTGQDRAADIPLQRVMAHSLHVM